MTDSDLDRRLQAAGERWRGAEDDVALRPVAARRRPWLLVASAAAVVAALVGGGVALWTRSDSPVPVQRSGASIGTATWHARSFSAGPNYDLVALNGAATLRFTDGRVEGSDGCNGIDATARVGRDTIAIGDHLQTEIGCAGADTVDRVLTGTVTYSVTPVALTITKRGVGTLFLTRGAAPPQQTEELTGTWVLTGTQTTSKDGATGSGSSISPTGDSGRLVITGSAFTYLGRCYLLKGRSKIDRGAIEFVTVHLVAHSCPPQGGNGQSAPDRDAFVRGVLVVAVRGQVDGGQLTITRGTRGLIFERAR